MKAVGHCCELPVKTSEEDQKLQQTHTCEKRLLLFVLKEEGRSLSWLLRTFFLTPVWFRSMRRLSVAALTQVSGVAPHANRKPCFGTNSLKKSDLSACDGQKISPITVLRAAPFSNIIFGLLSQ